jgi:hypothetical protein
MLVGHLTGGECLQAVQAQDAKDTGKRRNQCNTSRDEARPSRVTGYGVKFKYDVPQGKRNGQLEVGFAGIM